MSEPSGAQGSAAREYTSFRALPRQRTKDQAEPTPRSGRDRGGELRSSAGPTPSSLRSTDSDGADLSVRRGSGLAFFPADRTGPLPSEDHHAGSASSSARRVDTDDRLRSESHFGAAFARPGTGGGTSDSGTAAENGRTASERGSRGQQRSTRSSPASSPETQDALPWYRRIFSSSSRPSPSALPAAGSLMDTIPEEPGRREGLDLDVVRQPLGSRWAPLSSAGIERHASSDSRVGGGAYMSSSASSASGGTPRGGSFDSGIEVLPSASEGDRRTKRGGKRGSKETSSSKTDLTGSVLSAGSTRKARGDADGTAPSVRLTGIGVGLAGSGELEGVVSDASSPAASSVHNVPGFVPYLIFGFWARRVTKTSFW